MNTNPITLDDLKAYYAARNARESADGCTPEQRKLLERFAGVDLMASAICLIEQRDATITAQSRLLAMAETLAGAVTSWWAAPVAVANTESLMIEIANAFTAAQADIIEPLARKVSYLFEIEFTDEDGSLMTRRSANPHVISDEQREKIAEQLEHIAEQVREGVWVEPDNFITA